MLQVVGSHEVSPGPRPWGNTDEGSTSLQHAECAAGSISDVAWSSNIWVVLRNVLRLKPSNPCKQGAPSFFPEKRIIRNSNERWLGPGPGCNFWFFISGFYFFLLRQTRVSQGTCWAWASQGWPSLPQWLRFVALWSSQRCWERGSYCHQSCGCQRWPWFWRGRVRSWW